MENNIDKTVVSFEYFRRNGYIINSGGGCGGPGGGDCNGISSEIIIII